MNNNFLPNPFYSVFMRGVTWARDSHGLFDYESKNITKRSWTTQDQSCLLRTENDIKILPLKSDGAEG